MGHLGVVDGDADTIACVPSFLLCRFFSGLSSGDTGSTLFLHKAYVGYPKKSYGSDAQPEVGYRLSELPCELRSLRA
jgi:hypothetical protein